MQTEALIPFKSRNPKTRLSRVLDQEEREAFAAAMLSDVVGAVREAGCRPVVLATETWDNPGREQAIVHPAGLNEALNSLLPLRPGPVLIIMSDLPLVTSRDVDLLCGTDHDLVIAPGRGGGTNAIFIREGSRFRVDYYGQSFEKHKKIARDAGLSCGIAESFRLHTDIDEESDLVELLIHGAGRSVTFLRELGFSLWSQQGRVCVERGT